MMYKLNEIPIKTTNNFKINDIDIDLDVPSDYLLKDFEISSNYLNDFKIAIKVKEKPITSKIGLSFKKYLDVKILIYKYTSIPEPIILTYNFKESDVLVDNISIEYEESSSADFIIKYNSIDDGCHFHNLIENVKASDYSRGSVTIINNLNNNSVNMCSVNCDLSNNSFIKHNLVDLNGKIRIYNAYGEVRDNAENNFNNIYIGNNDSVIDMMYDFKNVGKKSVNNLVVEGSLNGNSKKKFRGIIDFLEGSVDSIGKENENCVLLSDSCISRSLPMLLCHEESVIGAHGESSGKVDAEKLFYLMSRGFSEKESEKLIITGNFLKIINEIPDSNTRDDLLEIIDIII